MYYTVESGAAAMCAGKAIHALHQGHQPHKNKPQKSTSWCPICTHSHLSGHDNCPAQSVICKGCSKKGHWHAKCCSSGTANQQLTKSNGAEKAPIINAMERGRKLIWYKLTLRKHPLCDELFVNVVDCGTVGDAHPEEIVVDDVHSPWCNEAYTTVQLPASISSKAVASLCIKANTGAGGNVLPLHVFQHLYPNWISPAGLPTGLDHVSTKLTAYNGSHIPLYGALCGPITWWPSDPGAQLCKVNSY